MHYKTEIKEEADRRRIDILNFSKSSPCRPRYPFMGSMFG